MNAAVINRVLIVLSFAGVFVSGFLSLSYAMNVTIPCGIGSGCDVVAKSPQSMLAGIPIAYFGLLAYVTLAALATMRALKGMDTTRRFNAIGLAISGLGTLISFYLMYASFFVIEATCTWCVASAILMTLLFIGHAALLQTENYQVRTGIADRMILGAMAILVVGGLGARAVALGDEKNRNPLIMAVEAPVDDLAVPEAPSMGNPDAPVVVIEFMDMLCPYCRESYHDMKDRVNRSNGQIRYVVRHFALNSRSLALPAAVISEIAAEKGMFWSYVDELFKIQPQDLTPENLLQIASSLGFDRKMVAKRLLDTEDRALKRVQEDMAFADRHGMRVAPVFFIGRPGEMAEVANINQYRGMLDGKYRSLIAGG
jgi:uncharacterized membrane protein